MHLHASLPNAQLGGEMTGFLRLGEQSMVPPLEVSHGRVSLPTRPGLGVDVNKKIVEQRVRRRQN
jgi:L-alanine-DL-glutamate epimerase-like enolase superfamily enzyme